MLTLLYFTAQWCGPCKAFGPVMDSVADEVSGEVTVRKVDIEHDPKLAGDHLISSIPTVIIQDDRGRTLKRMIGAKTREELHAAINEHRNA